MTDKVCVLGLGYIGLPTAALFATHGHEVVGVDVDPRRVEMLKNHHTFTDGEPGLATLVSEASQTGRFRVTEQIEPSDVFIISVPTPLRKTGRSADLRSVRAATQNVARILKRADLVVLESTVPPGTTHQVVLPLLERSGLRGGRDFSLVHCPERAVPGHALYELIHNDRTVGGIDPASGERAKALYGVFVKGEILTTDATTAEMVKLMENTSRDVNIAIANEFALLAVRHGVDVWKAIELVNRHPRVKILRPGPGVGGHCIPVDPWFLAQGSPEAALIRTARRVNTQMPGVVAAIAKRALRGIRAPRIAVLGVTYKGNVADTRESPAVDVLARLPSTWTARVHDPRATRFQVSLLPLDDAVRGADCFILMADHDEYLFLDPNRVGALMRHRILIDTRNHLDHAAWTAAGYRVFTLGRPASTA